MAVRRILRPSLVTLFPALLMASVWTDPSPHTVRLVEVEPNVKLEVLDWGGTGKPLLLLAGHGDSAHVFDDFAPRLTSQFHVYGVTRRGFGASSQPDHGYDLARMTLDLLNVIDTLKLDRVHLAGHSIAGDEMTRFAVMYPDRVLKLVYLEAAYDRVEAQKLEKKFPSTPAAPQDQRESGTPQQVRAIVARSEILMPEAEIRATRTFGPDGQLLRSITPDKIVGSVATMVEHPDYRDIRAPILAIYAVYRTPVDMIARYKKVDPSTRRLFEQVFDLWQPYAASQRQLLRESVPQARIDEIPGAGHYVFISHRDKVLRDMRDFLTAR